MALARAEKERKVAMDAAKTLDGVRDTRSRKRRAKRASSSARSPPRRSSEALERKGIEIDRKKLVMPTDAIKQTGEYELYVKYPAGVRATFKLTVVTKS